MVSTRILDARPFSRPQYLRIQALHLQRTGRLELTRIALKLLDQLIADYPESSELASAFMQSAEGLEALGHRTQALSVYRASLDARRRFRGFGNDGYLGYAELVIALGRQDLFDEALAALDEFGEPSWAPFPIQQFRIAAARALISDERGEHRAAQEWALKALGAASRTESGFQKHPDIGLVGRIEEHLVKRLRKLAAGLSTPS